MATGAEERVSGVVLAAGAGERMGGSKAMLLVDGEPLARLHARRLREAGCGTVVIVTRAELVARLAGDGLVVASGAPDPAGSLAVGLAALAPRPDDVVIVTPVDAWPARVATIQTLVSALRTALAATPRHGGRGGHPVVARASVLWPLRGEPRPLREVLAGLGAKRVRVDVEDEGIVVDLDTPEDALRVTGERPRFG